MRRIIFAIATVMGLVGGILTAGPAFANTYPQTVTLNSWAMNRGGGGTGNGTTIIAYSPNDPNDDNTWVALTGMCANGVVTLTCPFALGSGLNVAFEGDEIVMQWSPRTDKCVGTDAAGTAGASLQPCPDNNGNGGGWSTIQVIAAADSIGSQIYYVEVNKNWSNREYGGGGRCYGYGCALIVGAPNGYRQKLNMGTGDANVRIGDLPAAQQYDQWSQFDFNCNC